MLKKALVICLTMVLLTALILTGCSSQDAGSSSSGGTEKGSSSDTSKSSGDSKDAEPILIGAVYPLSGPVASTGQNIKKGIDFALNEINSKGGINGRPIEIIFGDSQGDPKIGMAETERLITKENVVAMIGAYQSAVTEVVSQVAERYQTPLLTAISTADALTTRGYKYFFRMAPTNMMYLRDMIQFVVDSKEKYGEELNTVAVVADNTLLGQETAKWAKYWAEKNDLEVVEVVLYTKDAADLTSEVLTLKSAQPDVVVLDPYISDAILLTKTMHEQGFKTKVMIGKATGLIDPNFLPNVKELANGITTAVEWNGDLTKGGEINQRFMDEYGISMNGHSAEAYTGLWTLKTAVETAEKIEREAIKDSFTKLNIEKQFPNGPEIILPYDKIAFESLELEGETHTNTNTSANLAIAQIQDLEYKTVWPFEFTENEPVIPLGW